MDVSFALLGAPVLKNAARLDAAGQYRTRDPKHDWLAALTTTIEIGAVGW